MGFIDNNQLNETLQKMPTSPYRTYLENILSEEG
jgi:hypothetical protein